MNQELHKFLYGKPQPKQPELPTAPMRLEYLRRILDYDPATGKMFWPDGKEAGFTVTTQSGTYRYIGIGGRRYTAGRIAWYYHHGVYPRRIYFLDGDGTNPRIANLTINNKILRNKLQGVSYKQKDKRWYVTIGDKGENIFLGRYNDFFEACCVRKSWENQLNYLPGVKKQHGKAKEQRHRSHR